MAPKSRDEKPCCRLSPGAPAVAAVRSIVVARTAAVAIVLQSRETGSVEPVPALEPSAGLSTAPSGLSPPAVDPA